MPEAIKKVYNEYIQKNEQYQKDREKKAPEAIEKGYPQDINFKALPEQILPHLETLVKIAKGKLYSPFHDNEEAFFKENKRFVKRSTMARMSHMEIADIMEYEVEMSCYEFYNPLYIGYNIQQDLDISYSKAYEILISSHKYGNYTYNDVVDEDYDD
ncbi:hypothetical protein BDA99DRAFT_544057 [Phascolomyces articulosus]|uniref:Uncharacterized protein n=1 Tax=Phascolomyces articulosus TaxID=60185 RepID=A0AAD5JLX5_9FUNG|nr:hypothetical protein BDA99DRAFT_544057 [Phascolomyces articulosus]